MIVLDTNALSEMMKASPDAAFSRWMLAHDPAEIFTTAICEAEILYGLALLPAGRRRNILVHAADAVFATLRGNILPFDSKAARAFADIAAARRQAGRPISEADGQIAAVGHAHSATLATRNVSDFAGCGVRIVSPWDS